MATTAANARSKQELYKQPGLQVSDILDISNQITGLQEKTFVLENKTLGLPHTVQVSSVEELKAALQTMKDDGQFPAVIRVSAQRSPFDQAASTVPPASKTGTWHMVCVTDYDALHGKVSIDNQWGSRNDIPHLDVAKLYKATLPPDNLGTAVGPPVMSPQEALKRVEKPIF